MWSIKKIQENSNSVDAKYSIKKTIKIGNKEIPLRDLGDFSNLLNNRRLIDELDANGIDSILLYAEIYKNYSLDFDISGVIIGTMLNNIALRQKLLQSHILRIVNISLDAAYALVQHHDLLDKCAANILIELLSNKQYLTSSNYYQTSNIDALISLILKRNKLYENLPVNILLAAITRGYNIVLTEEILASKTVRQKLDANSIWRIINSGIFVDISVAKYEDLCVKLPPQAILKLEDKYFCANLLFSHPSVVELWVSGALEAIKKEENSEQRFDKAKVMLNKLENIYKRQLKPETDLPVIDISNIKRMARLHFVQLIKNSGLSKEQCDNLADSVKNDVNSVINRRSVFPNKFSKFFPTKTAVDFDNEFKQNNQENKQTSDSKKIGKDLELNDLDESTSLNSTDKKTDSYGS